MSSLSRIPRSLLTRTTLLEAVIPRSRPPQPRFAIINNNNITFSSATRTFPRPFHSTAVKMVVHNIESKDAFTDAVKSGVVVLDCFATWCGPCKVIAPQVVKYSDEYPSVHFIKLDVDEIPDVAQELGIRAMPTFLIFKDGEKVGEVVGANPPALRAAIEKAVKN